MTISKWVNVIFVCVAMISFVVFNKSLEWLWSSVEGLTNQSLLGSTYITTTSIIATALAAAFTFWLYRRPGTFSYLGEVVVELDKVTWPTLDETKRSTLIVIVFTVLLSSYLAVFDQIWKWVTDFIIKAGV